MLVNFEYQWVKGQKGCFLAQKRGKTSNIANVPNFNQLNLDQSTSCLTLPRSGSEWPFDQA